MNERLQWIDVTDRIKTWGDLRAGDIAMASSGLQFEVTAVTSGRVSIRAFDGQLDYVPKTGTFTSCEDEQVLRRWDRLDKKPYTVELAYESDGEPYRAFVEVDPALPEKEQIKKAIRLAKEECLSQNSEDYEDPVEKQRALDAIEPLCVMRDHVWQEELP